MIVIHISVLNVIMIFLMVWSDWNDINTKIKVKTHLYIHCFGERSKTHNNFKNMYDKALKICTSWFIEIIRIVQKNFG